ncbi:hypothetical protein, partial [Cyanobium sp. LEGE 06113]|uniref:hypothetical protein n=1 Tax=Cyanobium sp. LEGE 06113 TaxID=1297573 RepID=UPI001D14D34C
TASAFCCAVNRRLVLVGLVIDGQSGGHDVTLTDLSSKPGEPQFVASVILSTPMWILLLPNELAL